MDDNGDGSGASKAKSWERSWTTDEMRQNAHSWNLAGDAGLLKHLQEFSQAVLARTHTTEKSLDLLHEEVNTLTSELNNTNNKFLCLANTQFVENRVYDDDDKETPQVEVAPEKKSKEETEAKMLQKVREALSMSVAVLDTMFEPVDLQASDSEGESDGDKLGTKTLILEPHNPYIHRPLPYLIGSEQFMVDDQIGLGDTPSDDEDQLPKTGVDQDMETSSESGLDFNPFPSNKRERDFYSSHSSISDHPGFQERSEEQSKKIKSESVKNLDEEPEEVPKSASIGQSSQTNSTFAAQLAAKLDKIASPHKNVDQRVQNSAMPSKSTSDDLFGGVQSDEEDDGLFTSNSNLFSGRPKLFDDLKDTSDSLWGPEEPEPIKTVAPEKEKAEPDFHNHSQSRVATDLFSSNLTDDEDDLFSIKPRNPPKSLTTDIKSQLTDQGTMSSVVSKQHHLKVGEIRPGLATSTPERGHEEENSENNSGFFGSVSRNLTQETSAVDVGAKSSTAEDEPASRNGHPPSEKKPAGGVPMFGQANILAGLKAKLPRRQSSSSSESSNSDPTERNSLSPPKSSSTLPIVDQPTSDTVNADQGWGSNIGASQHSQSASHGFASPALTSTRLSNDDGYQTRNVLNSVSSIPPANAHDNDSEEDNIFQRKSSAFDSHNPPSLSAGLFAEVNDEDDDLFAVSPVVKKVENDKSQSVLSGTSASSNEEKVLISGTNEVLKTAKPPSPKITSHSSIKTNPERSFLQSEFYSAVPPPLKSDNKIKKPVSLFDDSDSGEDEFLFSSASSAGSRRSQASTDILATAAVSVSEKKPLSKKGLFDDDDTLFGSVRNDPDIDIFSGPSKPVEKNVTEEVNKPTTRNSFIEEDVPVSNDNDSSPNPIMSSVEKSVPLEPKIAPKQVGLFQDDLFAEDVDNDDLFSIKPTSAPESNKTILNPPNMEEEEDDLFQTVSAQKSKHEIVQSQPTSLPKSKSDDSSIPASKPSLIIENTVATDRESNNGTVSDNVDINKVSSAVKKYNLSDDPNIVAQTSKKPEPPRTLNIRKETDPALGLLDDSEDDDLFGTSVPKTSLISSSPPKLPQKPQIASKPEPISVSKADDLKISDNEKSSPVSLIKPQQRSEVDGATVSVSKLKDSLLAGSNGQPALKIDPRAFLPGQKLPPRKTPPKEDTDGSVSSLKEPLHNSGSENVVGFEQPISNNAVLPSANKDRAKLGVKRRPPSNKARREAARASMNLDQSDKESPISPDASAVTDSTGAINNSITSNNCVLSPSTDEDDLFGVPQDLPPEYGNQTLPSSDIFSEAPILSPLSGVTSLGQSHQDNVHNVASQEEKQSVLETKASLFSAPDLDDTSKTEELFVSQPLPKQAALPVAEKYSSEANSIKGDPITTNSLLTTSIADQVIGNTIKEISESLSKPNAKIHEEDVISSQFTSAVENTVPISTTDPLNKADQSFVSYDDERLQHENDFEGHSSLFPFVKKKPENKISNNQPLFSQTPALPSKEDVSVSKPGLGGLDDVDDDDLFSSSSRNKIAIGKKTLDTSSKLRGKETKAWKFSDEDDDDDLFQTASKASSANSSTKATIPASSSALPVDSKQSTSNLPKSTMNKSKPMQPSSGNGLFSDENDEDNDLFSKPSPFSKNKLKTTPNVKSATLFDDDDDDLFGSKSIPANKAIEKNISKDTLESNAQVSTSSRHSNEGVFDDPLMSLGNKK